jgi:fermentation-respiration switch protein FrsA (DUF1100 family)
LVQDTELKKLKVKMIKRTIWILLAIFFVFAAIVNSIGLLAGAAFYHEFCEKNTRFELERFQPLESQLEEGIRTKGWRNVSIESRLGYTLQGTYLPATTPSDNTVVFVHGVAASRLMGLWYAPLYLDHGYNVLIYDSRASGESGGQAISWGYYEKYDLDQWLDWLEDLHPNGILGVHGVSMGAATALMHAELNERSKRVKFYVADSAYTNLEKLLLQQIDASVQLHHPWWVNLLFKYSSAFAHWKTGFYYEDVSPIDAVFQVTTPILYVHGEIDPLVPSSMCDQLYQATKGYREKHIFPGDKHAMTIFNHRKEYQRLVLDFIKQIPK